MALPATYKNNSSCFTKIIIDQFDNVNRSINSIQDLSLGHNMLKKINMIFICECKTKIQTFVFTLKHRNSKTTKGNILCVCTTRRAEIETRFLGFQIIN